MGKELWLFTISFPYGHGESFLENELAILTGGFDRVRLFPLLPLGDQRPLPAGVEVERLFTTGEAYRSIALWRLLLDLPRVLKVWQQAKRSAPSPEVFAKHRREFRSLLWHALERERLLRERLAARHDPDRTVLYSYWTSDWATVLGLWKMRDKQITFITRMHGFDMYAGRAADGWQKFQAFHLAQARRILIASQAGMDELTARYPEAGETFVLARLGTKDHGPGPWENAPGLRIASCSNLMDLKRVHLIAEALGKVEGPVKWTHFGEGEERARVESVVSTLPPNIHVELMGSRPNAEVIAWYRSHAVDVFVHASFTEGGAPVALQEAASFGIPLIAADAGGVREIVTDATGILLPNALPPGLLGSTLNTFKHSGWYNAEARAGVRAFWASEFKAEEVYRGLLRELLEPR